MTSCVIQSRQRKAMKMSTLNLSADSLTSYETETAAPRLTFWKITFAVMLGNLMAAAVAAIVYAAVTH